MTSLARAGFEHPDPQMVSDAMSAAERKLEREQRRSRPPTLEAAVQLPFIPIGGREYQGVGIKEKTLGSSQSGGQRGGCADDNGRRRPPRMGDEPCAQQGARRRAGPLEVVEVDVDHAERHHRRIGVEGDDDYGFDSKEVGVTR